MSWLEQHRRKAEEELKDEQRLARERAEIEQRLKDDPYNKLRETALNTKAIEGN